MARELGCIATRRELDATVNSIQALVVFMLQALKSDGSSNLPKKTMARQRIEAFFSSYKLGVSVMGTGVTIERIQAQLEGVQDAFYNELIRIWNNISSGVPAVVFLLDEAERLENFEGAWSFLRSVFVRVAEEGGRYMLVVSGKSGFLSSIKESVSPVLRFLPPLEVKPMTLDETREALQKPLAAFSRELNEEAVRTAHQLSAGHPYVLQTFGFYAFQEGTRHITRKTIEKVLPKVMTRLSTQLFRQVPERG